MSVAIVDLGYGNIGAIAQAFRRLGAEVSLTADAAAIAGAARVVLPGVGAAGYAMERIDALQLRSVLSGRRAPLLGICLGMQLLFEASDEGEAGCLGLIAGRVRRLVPTETIAVPHMGWSRLEVSDPDCGLRTGDYTFFAHGFACDDGPVTMAVARHGRSIPAAVRQGHLWGAQFHPERSAEPGARFLAAFLAC